MMQMVVAGGIPALSDGLRTADENNPRGYFEWEPAKTLKEHPEKIVAAEGKAVKIISALLPQLPDGHDYRVLFMIRPLEEVVASQNKMLQRLGREVPKTPQASVIAAFEKHLKEIDGWLAKKSNIKILRVEHAKVLTDPKNEAARISDFLGYSLDVGSMARQVERSLHRERVGSVSPAAP